MSSETQREEELFDEARRLASPAERSRFLDQACADHPALRARLASLLEAETDADRFFTESGTALKMSTLQLRGTRGAGIVINATTGSVPGEEPIGTRIG